MLRGLIFSFGFLATALSMIFLDQDWALYFSKLDGTALWLWARRITNIGLGEYWFGLAIVVFVLTKFWPRGSARWTLAADAIDRLRRWSVYLFAGLLGSGLMLLFSKWAIGRGRPGHTPGFDPLVFQPWNNDWYFQSLPSGHTQVLFSAATSLALLWPRLAWLIYPAAFAVAFTRVMTFQHWASDVCAGALLGYFGTLWVHSWVARVVPRPNQVSAPKNHSAGAAV